MLKYFLAWSPLILIAILNGTAREFLYKQYVGELAAHQLSTLTMLIFTGIYCWIILAKYPPRSPGHAWSIGTLWLVLTLCFEFGLGIRRGLSLEAMLADYNLLKGRVWVFIPIWITVLPYLFFRFLKA